MINTLKDVKEAVAKRLKISRKAQFFSPEQFCKKYRFPLDEYVQHEDGKIPIPATQIAQYCETLNISLAYILLGKELRELQETPRAKMKKVRKKRECITVE